MITDEQMADTHAKLTEIAALSLNVEDLVAYVERIRTTAPVCETRDHVDLALAIAGVQQISHRLFFDASAA